MAGDWLQYRRSGLLMRRYDMEKGLWKRLRQAYHAWTGIRATFWPQLYVQEVQEGIYWYNELSATTRGMLSRRLSD